MYFHVFPILKIGDIPLLMLVYQRAEGTKIIESPISTTKLRAARRYKVMKHVLIVKHASMSNYSMFKMLFYIYIYV